MMRSSTLCLVIVSVVLAAALAGAAPPPFANPPELASVGGQLTGTLTVAPGEVEIAGKRFTTTLYDGAYMPPVLRVQPGDTIRLALANAGGMATNIHYHGLSVTPLAPGDDVFTTVNPGVTYQYDFPIPPEHSSGLFWYHPHVHPDVNPQIAGGMSGGMIIGDVLAPFPQLAGITERVMLLKDMKLRKGSPVIDPDPSGSTLRTINGLYQPRIDIKPGELQLWRIGNIGANIYYRLRLPQHVFYLLSQDGNPTTRLIELKELVIPPAARYEVLVRGARPGKYRLQARAFNTGPAGDHYPAQLMATVVSRGPAMPKIPLPTVFPSSPDLRLASVTTRRNITFADADSNDPEHAVHHQRAVLRPQSHRYDGGAGDGRGVDAPEHVARAARVPHPSNRLPGGVGRRRAATVHRLPGHRESAVCEAEERPPGPGRGEGDHPVHRTRSSSARSSTTATSCSMPIRA